MFLEPTRGNEVALRVFLRVFLRGEILECDTVPGDIHVVLVLWHARPIDGFRFLLRVRSVLVDYFSVGILNVL